MISLHNGEALILYGDINSPLFNTADALTCLTEFELKKFHSYRFKDDRLRFLLARYILKSVASKIAGREIGEAEPTFTEFGKPIFTDIPLHFSISHSGRFSSVAFSLDYQLGLDIEMVRSVQDAKQLSKRFFSIEENLFLEKTGQSALLDNFFRVWSAKEAYIKALGRGISKKLQEFSVVDAEGTFAVKDDAEKNGDNYMLNELNIGSGYKSFLCTANSGKHSSIIVQHFL